MSENMYSSAHIVDKRRVAAVSVIAAFFLCILKLFVGLWTGSLGLLSDAAHSGLDFLAALMTFVSVSLADRPADPSHPYGHQKFDNLAALFEALLLAAAVAWIVYEAIMRLFFKAVPVTVNIASFAVLLTCICIDYLRCTRSSRAAKQTGSAALEANAYHFLSDIATSFVVLIGLVGTSLGYPQADAVCALAVSALILSLAYSLAKKAIDALTDRVPDDHIDEVRRTALTVPGVGDVYDVRVRHAGNRHFIDLKAGVSGSATLDTAHALSDAIEDALKASFSNADVVVHVEPRVGLPVGLTETLFVLARNSGINVHSVQLLYTDQGIHCTMHLEWPSDIRLGDAHAKATKLEEELQRLFPNIAAIRSHLECSDNGRSFHCSDVTVENAPFLDTIHRTAADCVSGVLGLRDIHIIETGDAWEMSLVCLVDPDISLRDSHRIATDLERRLRTLSPRINAVHIHTEPHVHS